MNGEPILESEPDMRQELETEKLDLAVQTVTQAAVQVKPVATTRAGQAIIREIQDREHHVTGRLQCILVRRSSSRKRTVDSNGGTSLAVSTAAPIVSGQARIVAGGLPPGWFTIVLPGGERANFSSNGFVADRDGWFVLVPWRELDA